MLSTCSLYSLSERSIMIHHVPEHSETQPFYNKYPFCSRIILNPYFPYDTFIHYTGFDIHVYI